MVQELKEMLAVLRILKKTHQPTMLEQLSHWTPFQLTVATLLSARSKDATVIPIVKRFFAKYPTVYDVAELPETELHKYLYGVGFYKVKSRYVKNLAIKVIQDYDGKIPNTRDELMSLPGVGRKTANCVLSYCFNVPAIAVDVHLHRIVNPERLNWMNTSSVEETEEVLMNVFPKKHWNDLNKLIVDHGQRICGPVRPRCSECGIKEYCSYKYKKTKA